MRANPLRRSVTQTTPRESSLQRQHSSRRRYVVRCGRRDLCGGPSKSALTIRLIVLEAMCDRAENISWICDHRVTGRRKDEDTFLNDEVRALDDNLIHASGVNSCIYTARAEISYRFNFSVPGS